MLSSGTGFFARALIARNQPRPERAHWKIEVAFDQIRPQRRRSERVAKSLPIVVRGTDLLGQPFEERTATLNFNLHGCRYASRYHLPKNAWITLEVPRGCEFENARARVAWIQRPHSVREFFQISVELEAPQNIWKFEPPPEDWTAVARLSIDKRAASRSDSELRVSESQDDAGARLSSAGESGDEIMDHVNGVPAASESVFEGSAAAEGLAAQASDDLSSAVKPDERATRPEAVFGRSGRTAAMEDRTSWMSEDIFEKWKHEFELLQQAACNRLSSYQAELLGDIKAEFAQNLEQAKWLIAEIEKSREALRAENEAAALSAGRPAQERAATAEGIESEERADPANKQSGGEEAAVEWRERLASLMNVAQGQWNELLESSLDRGVHRLAEKLSERAAEVGQPLVETVDRAQEAAGQIRWTLDEELRRAKTSLAEIERSAAHLSGLSGQIDAATSSALEELNRRLELVLNAQTEEMGERAEKLTGRAVEKAASEIGAATRTAVEDALAEIESRLNPHYERVPELLRELSMKEVQAEESLRLQRERLRQISETSRREFLSNFEAAVGAAQNDFETARQTAAAKWNEEVEASASLAARTAADAAQKASEGLEEQSRARLQSAADEMLRDSSRAFAERAADAKQNFSSELETVSADRMTHIRQESLDFASNLSIRSRAELERAAEAAAAAFGQVLRDVSDQEIETFRASSAGIALEQKDVLETSARGLLRKFETSAESSLARFHQQLSAQLETSIAEGRSALSSEFNASLVAFRSEREAHEGNWAQNLERLNAESAARYQERVDTACDSWVVSSVRRLNEHGQNLVESLVESADDAVRESCAKLFDGLAGILRERSGLSGHPGHSAAPAREGAEAAAAPPPADSD
jgi:hypothetical protein